MIDEIQVFERALGTPSGDRYIFQLFVTGTTPRSMRAIQNLRKMCDTHLEGRYEMKVVDIYQHPEQARSDQILVTPTLIKSMPLPIRRLIGDLSNTERVLISLDIVAARGANGTESPSKV